MRRTSFAALALLAAAPTLLWAGSQVTIVNADAAGQGLNDATAATPVGGNPGTTLGQLTYAQTFGFMIMDKLGPQSWSYTAYQPDGTVLTRCTQVATACSGCTDPTPGKQITCNPFGSL